MGILLEVNFYSLFYWLTVADGAKNVLRTVSIITLVFTVISIIGYFISTNAKASSTKDTYDWNSWGIWINAWKNAFYTVFITCIITGALTIFIPTKKDSLIIIAGGTVGNFVTQDSSARKIPSEVLMLLRTKIKDEINVSSLKEAIGIQTDTLKGKTKEELLKIIKERK